MAHQTRFALEWADWRYRLIAAVLAVNNSAPKIVNTFRDLADQRSLPIMRIDYAHAMDAGLVGERLGCCWPVIQKSRDRRVVNIHVPGAHNWRAGAGTVRPSATQQALLMVRLPQAKLGTCPHHVGEGLVRLVSVVRAQRPGELQQRAINGCHR